jgi:hypothetical protein
MTLLVHDEVDVVGDQIAFHLAAGVDHVIATDHRSGDGTTEVLERYEREGRLTLLREDAAEVRQSEWVTRMARLAASEHGADWVINSDADEFWWPRAGSLQDALGAVPADVGAVRAVVRPFVPRPGEGWFAERMTTRLTLAAPLNDPATAFRHVAKVAHRADPAIVVQQGNHEVRGTGVRRLAGWFPLELFHFPLRSGRQLARRQRSAWPGHARGDLDRARSAFEGGRLDVLYDAVALGDEAVARGVAEGWLVEDTRLRDALRGGAGPGTATAAGDVSRAVDGACLLEAESVRLQRRADELRARLVAREARRPALYRSRAR